MAEQQQAAQTPNPTNPVPPPLVAPVRPAEPKEITFKGDVSALRSNPAAVEEEQDDEAAESGNADPVESGGSEQTDTVGDAAAPADEGASDAEEETAAGTATGEDPVDDPEPEPEATEPEPAPAAPAAGEKPAAPQPTPADQRAARKGEVRTALKDISTKLAEMKAAGSVDPFASADLQAEATILQNELAEINNEEVEDLQAAGAKEAWWAQWASQNADVGLKKGRDAYLEEEAKAFKRFGSSTPEQIAAAQAVATVAWENRVGLIKKQAELRAKNTTPAATKPTAPAGKGKPGGPPTIPAQTTSARPLRQPQTPEEAFAANVGSIKKAFS